MRMPLFTYFVVVGFTLTLALLYLGNHVEPHGSPIVTSQIVGVAKPFKPEPERSPYKITGTNFAAAHRPATDSFARAADDPKPGRQAESLQSQKPATDAESRGVPVWKRVAKNPIAAMMSVH